jgi:DNA-binding winged helix-turn-helix (wHTH) protein
VQAQEHLVYRLGPYELDGKLLELRKEGRPVKFREQACRILLFLLEQPGELITREELRQRLWTDDTFVNFDKSLNTAVNTLREVLCDSATEPCYVQTVPRQGLPIYCKS